MDLRRNDNPPPDEEPEIPLTPEETQAEMFRAITATADAVEHIAYLFEKYLLKEGVIGPDDTEYQDLD